MCTTRRNLDEGVVVRLLRCDPNICELLPCSIEDCSGTICREHMNGHGIWDSDSEIFIFDEFAVCSHQDHLGRCSVAFCSRHARDGAMQYSSFLGRRRCHSDANVDC